MKQNKFLMIAGVLLLSLALLFTSVNPAKAAEIDDDGLVAAGETIDDDLMTGADMVIIDGTVNGNLLVGGQTVTINGTVKGDALIAANAIVIGENAVIEGNIFAASSTIEIAGKVSGGVFGASAALTVQAPATIDGNIYYAGYSVEMEKDTTVNKDLFTAVYQAMLNGNVMRDVRFAGGAMELGGSVGRNVEIDMGTSSTDEKDPSTTMKGMPFMQQPGVPPAIPSGLRVSKDAVIGGKLSYTSSIDQSAGIKAQPAQGIVFSTPVPGDGNSTSKGTAPREKDSFLAKFLTWLWESMRNFITLLLLGLAVAWKLACCFGKPVEQLRSKPMPSAGNGFVAILLGYFGAFFVGVAILLVGILISIFTLGGLSRIVFGLGFSSLALAFTVFTLLVNFGSKLVVAGLVGDWVMKKVSPEGNNNLYVSLSVGIVLYSIVASLPFIGWIFAFAATLYGYGAIWLAYIAWREANKAQVQVV